VICVESVSNVIVDTEKTKQHLWIYEDINVMLEIAASTDISVYFTNSILFYW